jgi:mevalonate kinase
LIIASAPGKCILFGEHAVVYGYPAIAIALNIRSYCIIEETNKENTIQFNIPDLGVDLNITQTKEINSQFPVQYQQFYQGMKTMSEKHGISFGKLRFRLESELWIGSGLGSSASISIAFVQAIDKWFNLNLSAEEINAYGFIMEKRVHGTPSGIDNTICNVGGAILIQKNTWKKLNIPKFPILVTYSGTSHQTESVIVTLQKNQYNLDKAFKKIKVIVEEGVHALKGREFEQLGELCNKNQEILTKLGLSTPNINQIITISKNNGAYGAKLTGAGVGGSVITLGKLKNLQKIQYLLQKRGYLSKICYMDFDGAKIDRRLP